MAIKAIETHYAGYRFRSRLEARWAVALTHLGYDWEYEAEGFETSAGWYLPDFRISGKDVVQGMGAPGLPEHFFFEVKGAPLTQPEGEKIAALVGDEPERMIHVMALGRIPDPTLVCDSSTGMGFTGWGSWIDHTGKWVAGQTWVSGGAASPAQPGFIGSPFDGPIDASRMRHQFEKSAIHQGGCDCGWNRTSPCLTGRTARALTAARSARFEHGETPTP